MWENGLIRKISLILKFSLTIAIPSMLRSKGNYAIKFGQLIEHNMKNIFLEKSYAKCGGETIPSPFSKKSKLRISLDQQPKNLFSLCTKLRTIAVYWNQTADHLLFPNIKFFWKTKRGLELVSLSRFLYDFGSEIFLLLRSMTWSIFIVWLLLLRELLGNMCIVIVC